MIDESGGRPDPGNVVAVIVTFFPDAALHERLAPLLPQVARVVIVDNGSGAQLDAALGALAREPKVEVVRNDGNAGMAAALNQGFARAVAAAGAWVLTLDQDAAPLPGLIRGAGAVYDDLPDPGRLAVLGAESHRENRPSPSDPTPWAEGPVAITAGSLIPVKAYERIGGFREDFFIDYVDIEFCLRARARGFRIVTWRTAELRHRIGEPTTRHLVFRSVTPTNHSPGRRYYMTRNRVRIWIEYGRSESRYVLGDALGFLKEAVKLALFEDQRRAKARSMARGLRDGLRGRSGRVPGVL